MDKMVAPSPLVFNFRVYGWLGISNQGALSISPHPPSLWSGAYSGWQALFCFTEPRSSGFQGGVDSANCSRKEGSPLWGQLGCPVSVFHHWMVPLTRYSHSLLLEYGQGSRVGLCFCGSCQHLCQEGTVRLAAVCSEQKTC